MQGPRMVESQNDNSQGNLIIVWMKRQPRRVAKEITVLMDVLESVKDTLGQRTHRVIGGLSNFLIRGRGACKTFVYSKTAGYQSLGDGRWVGSHFGGCGILAE